MDVRVGNPMQSAAHNAALMDSSEFTPLKDCANCGATDGLLRCSRCKAAWFCGLTCHKAYWPMHRSFCRANDFATAIEQSEPKFAAWLRHHGKQAVLKDDEVERLERASRAACALPSRQEVMESMYGRAEPKPIAPSYTPEEWLAMARRHQCEAAQAYLLSPQDRAWQDLPHTRFGHDHGWFRWDQDLSNVMMYVKILSHVTPQQVSVRLGKQHLTVMMAGVAVMSGVLCREVEISGSTWYIDTDTGILYLQLLKRSRKGQYLPPNALSRQRLQPTALFNHDWEKPPPDNTIKCFGGMGGAEAQSVITDAACLSMSVDARVRPATAADTWWHSLLQDGPEGCATAVIQPPVQYYMAGDAMHER